MQTRMKNLRPSSVKLLLALGGIAGLGCGGGSEKVVSVTGRVTRKDQPIAGLIVSFVPQGATDTGVSSGTTDNDGQYVLTVAKTKKRGAVVGTHKVWVSYPRNTLPPPSPEEKKRRSTMKRSGVPAMAKPPADLAAILNKYGNPDKTPLTVEVKKGEPIDLKLD